MIDAGPTVIALYTCPSAGAAMHEHDSVRAIPGVGLAGDRYALQTGAYSKATPPKTRHITLIAQEAIAEANAELEDPFLPSETRRNVITRGVDVNALVGREFTIGGVRIRGLEFCLPCARPTAITGKKGFEQAYEGRGGLRAEILSDGIIEVGAAISV